MPGWDDVCELGLALPGVAEETSYGTPALKVGGKLLVRLKEDGETAALRVDLEERQALVHERPEVFFVTPHYENYPMVLVRLGPVDRAELGELLTEAWLERAPKRVVAAWEADRAWAAHATCTSTCPSACTGAGTATSSRSSGGSTSTRRTSTPCSPS